MYFVSFWLTFIVLFFLTYRTAPNPRSFSLRCTWCSSTLLPASESESHSVMSDSATPWTGPGQNTGVGGFSLLQGIFPTQGLNQSLPHCRQILYQLSYQESQSNGALKALSTECHIGLILLWKHECQKTGARTRAFLSSTWNEVKSKTLGRAKSRFPSENDF